MNYRTLRGLARIASAGLCSAVLLMSAATAAQAVTLIDNYYGGDDFYAGNGTYTAAATGQTLGGAQLYAGDVISDASDPYFNITDAVISRSGPGGNTLNITIDTNYAGHGGLDGTGYGALFLTPGANAWNPTGTAANHYATDVYQPGEWSYAFTMPTVPNVTSGTGGLYSTSTGTVVMSSVSGDAISYPLAGNNGSYFRQGEAVQFTPGSTGPVDTGTWSVGTGTLTFSILDYGSLGNNFAMSWAMTCANDIIQGQVTGVPEPGTWVMMLLGFGAIGFAMRRKRSLVNFVQRPA
jgi:hypothetical protein